MKKSRFSESRIVAILKEADTGLKLSDICRKLSISDATYYNREAIAIEVDTSLRSARLVRLFERIKSERRLPDILRFDNGPEFLGDIFTDWCTEHGIFIDYIEPGKPNQNAIIERFNRSVRDEVLDLYLFRNLNQVREQISQRKMKYNEHRPHDSLGGLPPVTYSELNTRNSSFELSP